MNRERLKGFIKLSLSHHPLCWHFRSHTFSIGGLSFCLGCTGFYSGILVSGIIIIIGRVYQLNWFPLVCISTAMFIPTIFRLIKIPLFSSEEKYIRFLFRWLLGVGVAIGFVSIVKAPHVLIGLIQFVLGVGLYLSIGLNRIRSKKMWLECQDCSYTLAINCPGFSPFHLGNDLKE